MSNTEDYLEFENYYIASAKFASISCAVDLGIFEFLKDEPSSSELLALSLNLNRHVSSALLKALESLNLLKCESDIYYLNEKSKNFLLKQSRYYQGNEFLRKAHPEILQRFKQALQKGTAALEYRGQVITNMWQAGSIDKETAKAFTYVMDSMMAYPANYHAQNSSISNHKKLIDIGGGSGAWAIELCNMNSHITVEVFDLPEVLETTKEIIRRTLITERISLIPGNFFDSIPKGNIYLLSNILHDWPEDECLKILMNIHRDSEDKCSLYIHECLLDEGETSPTFTCIFNLLMAANHNSSQFTLKRLQKLLEQAGFKFANVDSNVGYYQLVKFDKVN